MLLEVSEEEEVSSDHDISFMCDKELSSDDGSTNNECTTHPGSDMMFVHWHQLKQLFKLCSQCGSTAKITKIMSTGALIAVSTECNLGHNNIWNSLPKEEQFYEGHTTLAASILLSGLTYQRFREAMDIANVQFFSKNTFYRIQNKFLFPAINNIYIRKSKKVVEALKREEKVCLVGDGCCDSPGFSATYGTYTLMNEKTNKIMDFFIAHVRIAGNSQCMEKYGQEYLLKYFESCGVKIDTITTDQHLQIRSFFKKGVPTYLSPI